ncbi:unnamed protein product [Didymodactylos carnosus]|uniref:Uncharacterized protein n=1 Tax=Didymodactylos carnosus TaxID=1234261 RepID=A0A813SAW0_9BILA|nr:unnamed protein product [Didymodactylos carnosus]CAF3577049.1 unnamed protein product [Didymodactylos carnosus]
MEHKLIRPPSPDFSTLTNNELEQLEQVLQKQAEIEYEQNQSLAGLRKTMIHLQQTIRNDNQQRLILDNTTDISTTASTTNCCYICLAVSNQNSPLSSSPVIGNRDQLRYCHDCHRPVCRRCGNYTSPDLLFQPSDENHSTSKWRCRTCLVKREVIKKSGTWNIGEESFIHSPIRLLHKLAVFRTASQSTNTSPTQSSPTSTIRSSSIIERKPFILEPSNFFSRLWRRDTSSLATPNHIITEHLPLSSHEYESSFDHLSDICATSPIDTNTSSPPIPSSPNTKRISLIREIPRTTDDSMLVDNTTSQTTKKLETQNTSSTITEPSFEDYSQSDQPYDTVSEIRSESFETNNGGNPRVMQTDDEDHMPYVSYNERQSRLNTNIYLNEQFNNTTTTTILTMPSANSNINNHHGNARYIVEHADSLASPEANIDLSMAMDYFSASMIASTTNENDGDHLQRKASRSVFRNSESWARKRALMKRDHEWTTTVEGKEDTSNNNPLSTNSLTSISTSYPSTVSSAGLKRTTGGSLPHQGNPQGSPKHKHEEKRRLHNPQSNISDGARTNSSSMNTSTSGGKCDNSPSESFGGGLHRRRSSRRLPPIPGPSNNKSNTNNRHTTKQTSSSSGTTSSGFSPLNDVNAPQFNGEDEMTDKFVAELIQSSTTIDKHPAIGPRENSLTNRSTRSKSIDSSASEKSRLAPKVLLQHTQNAKSIDVSNLSRQKSFLTVNSGLLPQRSIDYPCIVRKQQDLSDIVRRRMLYSKISKQDTFSSSVEREHVPKTPRKIIIRQDNSIEISLSKPPKLRRHTLSEDYYYGNEPEFATMMKDTANSTLLPIPTSCSTGGDRRKTIETCENIFLQAEESSKLRARTPPSNPHRVLLHRDKNDASKRTNGLGMRIVGGQECEDSSLGCFVTMILYGGPADVQGNIEVGDQILEFNGHSLIDSTYEEVRTLQDHCGDIVQLVVQHNNVRLQMNGQNMTSLEISRHFETVPRLGPSLTRKRRNLPPLPPSLSSTFPQSKRQLYETVETLEVPNVKELKPILINRGRLLAQIWHDVEDLKLALTIIQAGNLPLRPNGDSPYTYIAGKMLFDDRGFDMFETKVIHSCNPVWNETFVFHEVEKVDVLNLEIFLWDKKKQDYNTHEENDEFIGMVQLPLLEANLEDEPRWYELRDRQIRKPSTTSVTFKSSSNESQDSLVKVPTRRIIGGGDGGSGNELLLRALNRTTIKKSPKHNLINESNDRRSSLGSQNQGVRLRHKNKMNTNLQDSNQKHFPTPTLSPHLFPEYSAARNTAQRSSIGEGLLSTHDSKTLTNSTKLKRRISQGLTRLFVLRRFSDTSLTKSNMIVDSEEDDVDLNATTASPNQASFRPNRHQSECATQMYPVTSVQISSSPRVSLIPNDELMTSMTVTNRSSICQQLLPQPSLPPPLLPPFGSLQMQLLPPYMMSSRHSSISGSRKSSAASYCDSEDDIDRYFNQMPLGDTIEDSSNIHSHQLGIAQVAPRNYENIINDDLYMGQIQLGLMVTKGLLEIDVIMAKGLKRVTDGNNNGNNELEPPDTYVKTYLRTGTRRVQKRKTTVVKYNFNPQYRTKLNYNACNVMGRRIQVMVWQRAKKFEKNQCIGEAFISLDNLNLTQHTTAWYKLFREHTVESEFYDSS